MQLEVIAIGNKERLINTDLQYGFTNGSYFVYNSSSTLNIFENATDIPFDETESESGYYELERVCYEYINTNVTQLSVDLYENNTEVPTIPFVMSEWDVSYTDVSNVYDNLSSILQGYHYFPSDVFVDDLFTDDTSFRDTFFPITSMQTQLNALVDEGNITIVGGYQNSSWVVLTNNLNGIYYSIIEVDIIVNDLDTAVIGSIPLNLDRVKLIANFNETFQLNCYHTIEILAFGEEEIIQAYNSTNSSEYYNYGFRVDGETSLIYSTLPDCSIWIFGGSTFLGLSYLWWIVISIIATVGIVLVGVYLSQRSKCDSIIQLSGRTTFSKEDLNKLPYACQSDKYLKK